MNKTIHKYYIIKYQKIYIVLLSIFFLSCTNENLEENNIIREGPPPLKNPQYIDLGTFVVNMPGDKYFLKTSIQLAFIDDLAKSWLELRLPIVKDMLITHLQSITVEEFNDLRTRPIIKNNIKVRLNSLFPNKTYWDDNIPIKKILFSEFYKQ